MTPEALFSNSIFKFCQRVKFAVFQVIHVSINTSKTLAKCWLHPREQNRTALTPFSHSLLDVIGEFVSHLCGPAHLTVMFMLFSVKIFRLDGTGIIPQSPMYSRLHVHFACGIKLHCFFF